MYKIPDRELRTRIQEIQERIEDVDTRNTKYLRENGGQLKPLIDKRKSGTGVDRDVEYDVPEKYLLISLSSGNLGLL